MCGFESVTAQPGAITDGLVWDNHVGGGLSEISAIYLRAQRLWVWYTVGSTELSDSGTTDTNLL